MTRAWKTRGFPTQRLGWEGEGGDKSYLTMAVLVKSRKALEQKKNSHTQSLSSPPEEGGALRSGEPPTEGFLPPTFTKIHFQAKAGW